MARAAESSSATHAAMESSNALYVRRSSNCAGGASGPCSRSEGFGANLGSEQQLRMFGVAIRQRLTAASGLQPRSDAAAALNLSLLLRERVFLCWRSRRAARRRLLAPRPHDDIARTAGATLESVDRLREAAGPLPWLIINTYDGFFVIEACARVTFYLPFKKVLTDPFIYRRPHGRALPREDHNLRRRPENIDQGINRWAVYEC